jgi:DNA ligase (NAD+)
MGEKSATNVLKEVEKARSMSLGRFLHALGLPGIGPELAASMARVLGDAEGLVTWLNDASAEPGDAAFGPAADEAGKAYTHNAALRRLLEIDGVGEIVVLQFRDGLNHRRELVDDLLSLLDIQPEPTVEQGGLFDGMTFCVTGTLSRPRKEVQQRIVQAGGKVVGSVSGKLSVLVAGQSAGSKLAKAQSLGVTVWSEEDLEASIAGSAPKEQDASSEEEETLSSPTGQRSLQDFLG